MSVLAVKSGVSYIELPDPAYKGYKTVQNEWTKADRNTLGNLIKERITIKATIVVEWKGISKAEKDRVMSSTSANTFQARYLDMDGDEVRLGTFYRGDDAEIIGYGRFNGSYFQLYDVKISLVEV